MNFVQKLIAAAAVVVIIVLVAESCSEQSKTRSWGATMDVELEPNQKLIEVTWKDTSLWFLTKDMTDEDVAETYKFYEQSALGMYEGCVNISEIKLSKEELEEYNNQRKYEYDYNRYGNFDEYGNPVFIEYEIETNKYKLLKPYSYGEYDILVPEEEDMQYE